MNVTTAFIIGLVGGFVVASFLISPGTSDRVVAQGVRDKVASNLGGTAAGIGDALGLWTYTPGLAGLVS